MPISQSLNNALTGLNAASRGADLVSSNIANAATEGYAPRSLSLSARDIGGMGAGVRVNGVVRHDDPYLTSQRQLADARSGRDQAVYDASMQWEKLVNGPEGIPSLSDKVTAVESAFVAASGDPTSETRLEQITSALSNLTSDLKNASDGIAEMRQRAEQTIGTQVDTINDSLTEIDRLNDEILRTKKDDGSASGLIDQRQQAIDRISSLVPVRQLNRDGGRIALITTEGEFLLDHQPRHLEFAPAGLITADMTYGNGALSGITIDGAPLAGGGAVGNLSGGALAAQFTIRDELAPAWQSDLDANARSLLTRFSSSNADSSISPGQAGLLVIDSATATASEPGLAGRLKPNDAISATSGSPALIRDGLYATTTQGNGDSAVLVRWAEELAKPESLAPGAPSLSASNALADLESAASGNRIRAEDRLATSTAAQGGYVERELALGVDTDAELQNLMRIEKAYAANARVIQTIDTLLNRLLEI